MIELSHAGSRLRYDPDKKVANIIGPSSAAAPLMIQKAIESGIREFRAVTIRLTEDASVVLLVSGEHLDRLIETNVKPKKKTGLKQSILNKMKTPDKVNAAGVLVFSAKTRRFLLQVRGPSVAEPGKIGLFGGTCEKTETPIQTACREIKEEAGVDVVPSLLTKLSTFETSACAFHSFLLVVRDEFSPNLNEESASHAWMPAEGIYDVDVLPSVKFLFEADPKIRQIITTKADPEIDFERVVEQIIS